MLDNPATYTNRLLEKACSSMASDIHFHPLINQNEIQIYFRLLGKRQFIQTIPLQLYQNTLTFFKFSANMDIGQTRQPQNGRLYFTSKSKDAFSLRLSTLPLVDIESLTIRILPQNSFPTSSQLFFFSTQFKQMQDWLKQKSGMVIFSGPTGSGKSTTMYALLEAALEKSDIQAITLEDPIERQIEDVIQVEINEKAGITYHTGLKAALRHDPDLLMVGEIRDRETALFAFEAALTGHLVVSTIHANNAAGTIARLLDLGIKRIDILQTLIAVASIQLLPTIGNNQNETRAAIADILDGKALASIVNNEKFQHTSNFHDIKALREKAYMYGFITKSVYEEYEERN